MASRIVLNETSFFGAGSASVLPDEIKKRGLSKAFVVVDKGLIGVGPVERVEGILSAAGIPFVRYSEVKPNPTIKNVQDGVVACMASGADVIVTVGGGSAMDTAKAVGIIMTNPEFADVRSLEGLSPTTKPSLPVIALPTTAGTASEVTINYVVTDEERKRKFVCVDPHDIPVVAIVDSDLMATMPKGLAAATGMDALTHAIEGYITKGAWAMSDMFELKAIELIANSLRGSVLKSDPKAREDMALAQYIAGMGFSNVGLGLVHGMAHPLGAFYDTPHGVANALLLPLIMEFNADATGGKYRSIAAAMGVAGVDELSIADARKAACAAVRQLAIDVGIPQTLSSIGVKREDLPTLAKSAFADVCTPGNPRDTTEAEILELYEKAF